VGDEPPDPDAVAIAITGELDLHHFHPRDLRTLIPAYLEECHQRGILELRLIHGRGTGAVRDSVHALLRRSPRVRAFRLAGSDRGAGGATLVDLVPRAPES
jgi:DNA-nicking Smr family endonuclease